MSEPSLELQGAIVAKLKADAAVTALIAGRVVDRVDPGLPKPYVVVGDDQVISAHADCLDGSTEVFATLHAWSGLPGKRECKQVAGAVVAALNQKPMTVNGYRLVSIEHDSTAHLLDPDGVTSHSVIVFHAFVDEL